MIARSAVPTPWQHAGRNLLAYSPLHMQKLSQRKRSVAFLEWPAYAVSFLLSQLHACRLICSPAARR